MTRPTLAELTPASSCIQKICTLEPCTKCRQMAVCMPVTGRKSNRAYPYCVELCWPLARAAGETVVRAEPVRTQGVVYA